MPLYYARNKKGYSTGWVQVIKNSIARIAPHYTMKRQLDDYYSKFYNKLRDRSNELRKNNCQLAKEIAEWKETVAEKWDQIQVVEKEIPEVLNSYQTVAGQKYPIRIVIDEAGLEDAIGLELVTLTTDKDGVDHIYSVEPFTVTGHEGTRYTFELQQSINSAGSFKVAYRMFPKNDLLPHRQDFCYVRWL